MKVQLMKLIKYVGVGGLAAIINYGFFALTNELLKYLGIHYNYQIAYWIGQLCGLLANYFLALRFVFNASNNIIDFLKTIGVTLIGIVIGYYIVWFCKEKLGINEYIGNIISIGICFVWNYIGRILFIYNDKSKKNKGRKVKCQSKQRM